MVFNRESDFENALITLLFDKGWEPEVLRYPTEKDLLQNWAQILFENNRGIDRLNDAPLTDGEMEQILEQIKRCAPPSNSMASSTAKPSPSSGTIRRIPSTLSRGQPKDLRPAGDRRRQSRYQIAQQPIFRAKSPLMSDRRGDFMLLINGMPVIHVELKKSGTPVSQACYQIEKYAHEGVFTGLFISGAGFCGHGAERNLVFRQSRPGRQV